MLYLLCNTPALSKIQFEDLGPDYMSRAGPVSRAASVRAGPM